MQLTGVAIAISSEQYATFQETQKKKSKDAAEAKRDVSLIMLPTSLDSAAMTGREARLLKMPLLRTEMRMSRNLRVRHSIKGELVALPPPSSFHFPSLSLFT